MARVGKRNKTKFVLCKELVFLVLALVAMIVATIVLAIPSAKDKQLEEFNVAISAYNSSNSTSYNTLGEDNVFKKASLNKLEKELKNTGSEEKPQYVYVLYGSLTNGTVLDLLSKIDTEAKNRKVDVVYLYSSEKVDKQDDKDDEEFLAEIDNDEKVLNAKVVAGVDEVDLLKTPALYVYKNGELVFNSTTYIDDGSYNWNLIVNKAFTL